MSSFPFWTSGLMNAGIATAERTFNHYPTSAEGWREGGVDWTPPAGTPITALASGVIIGAGYFCAGGPYFLRTPSCPAGGQGYGVVTTRVKNIDGTLTDIYYQHIIIASGITLSNTGGVGQVVQQGQVIGYANPSFNIEVGINVGSTWGGIWGTNSPGPHVDPIPYLYNLIASGGNSGGGLLSYIPPIGGSNQLPFIGASIVPPVTTFNTVASNVHSILNTVPGFIGIVEALDIAEQFQPLELKSSATDTNPTDYTILGIDTGIPNPSALIKKAQSTIELPAENIQALIVFVTTNTMAFTIRFLLVMMGVVILVALVMNAQKQVSDKISPEAILGLVGA